MRIDLTNSAASQISSDPASQKIAAQKNASSNQVDTGDRTTLSSDTASVSSLVSTALSSPPIRQDMVNALRQSVNNGTYEVNPSKIAASIVDDHA